MHQPLRRDALVSVVIAITTWSAVNRPSGQSIDDGWRYAMGVAAARRVDFGSDLIFTYGPLAVLDGGPIHSIGGGIATVVVRLVLASALALLVLQSARLRGASQLVSAVLAWVVVFVIVPTERFSEVVVIVGAAWLCHQILTAGEVHSAHLFATAAVAGLWVNVKPSAAVILLVIVVLAAAPVRSDVGITTRLVRMAGAAGVGLGVTLGVWIAAGQSVGSLVGFVGNWSLVSAGYAEAMAVPIGTRAPIEFALIAAALGIGAVIAHACWSARTDRACLSDHVIVAVIVGGLLFWGRQITLSRPDEVHLRDGAVLAAVIGVVITAHLARRAGITIAAVGMLLVPTVALTAGVTLPASAAAAVPVVGSLGTFGGEVADLAGGELTDDRQRLAADFAVPESIVSAARGHSVHVSPYAMNVLFAHPGLETWLLPTIQHYVSFTATLEHENAKALAGASGPDLILHNSARRFVDGHHPAWESPLITHQIWCSFRPAETGPVWSLLKAAGTGCDQPVLLGSVSIEAARSISVPATAATCGGVVTFRISGAERSSLDARAVQVIRPKRAVVQTQGRTWPLIIGTADSPHIIAAPRADIEWLGPTVPTPADLDSSIVVTDLAGYFASETTPTIHFECWTQAAA